jgi:hypothetical protein
MAANGPSYGPPGQQHHPHHHHNADQAPSADRRTPEAYARSRVDYDTMNGGVALTMKNNNNNSLRNGGGGHAATMTMPSNARNNNKQSPYASTAIVGAVLNHPHSQQHHSSAFVPTGATLPRNQPPVQNLDYRDHHQQRYYCIVINRKDLRLWIGQC